MNLPLTTCSDSLTANMFLSQLRNKLQNWNLWKTWQLRLGSQRQSGIALLFMVWHPMQQVPPSHSEQDVVQRFDHHLRQEGCAWLEPRGENLDQVDCEWKNGTVCLQVQVQATHTLPLLLLTLFSFCSQCVSGSPSLVVSLATFVVLYYWIMSTAWHDRV